MPAHPPVRAQGELHMGPSTVYTSMGVSIKISEIRYNSWCFPGVYISHKIGQNLIYAQGNVLCPHLHIRRRRPLPDLLKKLALHGIMCFQSLSPLVCVYAFGSTVNIP